MEWAKTQYNKQYDSWVPWLEDIYLRYFTRDNKASYKTRGMPSHSYLSSHHHHSTHITNPKPSSETLAQTKVPTGGVPGVDALQDGVHNLVADQVGQDGLGRPVGDLLSSEGMNRVERKGKDDKGGYLPTL